MPADCTQHDLSQTLKLSGYSLTVCRDEAKGQRASFVFCSVSFRSKPYQPLISGLLSTSLKSVSAADADYGVAGGVDLDAVQLVDECRCVDELDGQSLEGLHLQDA